MCNQNAFIWVCVHFVSVYIFQIRSKKRQEDFHNIVPYLVVS